MTKAAIVIVPGAWHGPWAYQTLVDQLHAAGFDAVCVDLPSVAAATSAPRAGLEEDVKAIEDAIGAYIDKGREVVVAPHSYGGIPTAQACFGKGVQDRKKAGKEGGVRALVYIAAFMIPPGVTLLQALGGNHLPWFDLRTPDLMYWKEGTPKEVFYNDISQEKADEFIKKLVPISYKCFLTPTTEVAWLSLPTTFVFCREDQALPPSAQEMMIQAGNLQEEKGQVVRMDSGHSPFVSQPDKLVQILAERAA